MGGSLRLVVVLSGFRGFDGRLCASDNYTMEAKNRTFRRGQQVVLKRGGVSRVVTFVGRLSKSYSKVLNDAGFIEGVMTFQLFPLEENVKVPSQNGSDD